MPSCPYFCCSTGWPSKCCYRTNEPSIPPQDKQQIFAISYLSVVRSSQRSSTSQESIFCLPAQAERHFPIEACSATHSVFPSSSIQSSSHIPYLAHPITARLHFTGNHSYNSSWTESHPSMLLPFLLPVGGFK